MSRGLLEIQHLFVWAYCRYLRLSALDDKDCSNKYSLQPGAHSGECRRILWIVLLNKYARSICTPDVSEQGLDDRFTPYMNISLRPASMTT